MWRIGEFSRRVGVSDHVLRAWESRYGLLRPVRTAGGFRLYSAEDERRVERMRRQLALGLSAAEAARSVLAEESLAAPAPTPEVAPAAAFGDTPAALAAALNRALADFDEPEAQAVLDRALSDFSLVTALRDVVIVSLRDLGECWERGEISVTQEHFASHVIRGRLAGLARGWGTGIGPRAMLACPPDELHDLPLMVFGIVLHRAGWRVDYLGASTPMEALRRSVEMVHPDVVVLAATTRRRFTAVRAELVELARIVPVAIAGEGASPALADAVGAHLLTGDPATAAEQLDRPVAVQAAVR